MIKFCEIFELNYGPDKAQLFPGNIGFTVNWFHKELTNHSDAQNFILNEAFKTCDYAFNTNLDDFYASHRIEAQLPYLEQGYDIVSADMYHINESNVVTEHIKLSDRDVGYNFHQKHNIIAHPVCAYSKKFWQACPGFQVKDFPKDDFMLWWWAFQNGYRFFIVPDYLLYYRKHSKAVSNKDNAAKLKELWKK